MPPSPISDYLNTLRRDLRAEADSRMLPGLIRITQP
jgi:hypothetical protein